MTLTLRRVRLSVHPLGVLFPMMLWRLGGRADAAALLAALAIHEAAHLLCARALGVGVSRLRLMPVGGAIELENPYALPPARLLAVAAAGPLANGLAVLGAAALIHWRALSPIAAAAMRVNAALMLFNLLPALPLDGGRVLYALLSRRMSRARAAAAGIWAGRLVAALLLTAFAWGGVARGRFNLSLAMAAVFILASGRDERDALSGADARALLEALKPIFKPVPVKVYAVGADCSARDALKVARPYAMTIYAVYDDSRLSSFTDDRRLMEAVLEDGESRISEASPPMPIA